MGNLLSFIFPPVPIRGQTVDVVGGTVNYRPYRDRQGIGGRTRTEVINLLYEQIKSETGETGQPATAMANRWSPTQPLDSEELQLGGWIALEPRPVDVRVGGIGGAVVLARRPLSPVELAAFPDMGQDFGYVAVQRVSPLGGSTPRTQVLNVRQYLVPISRLIISLNLADGLVTVMLANGNTERRFLNTMLHSGDSDDADAIAIARRDFPSVWQQLLRTDGRTVSAALPAAGETSEPVKFIPDESAAVDDVPFESTFQFTGTDEVASVDSEEGEM